MEIDGVYSIRFHGRGGQGAKTASALLAEAAVKEGKHVQAFPEYGAERMGAPVKAYTRISDRPLRIHYGVKHPDLVVVIDFSLVPEIDVTEGLDKKGIIIVNTPHDPSYVKKMIGSDFTVYTIDASKIALEEYNKNVPNTPMLGAIVKATGVVDLENLKEELEMKMKDKLGEELFNKNIKALERTYEELKK